MANEPAKKSSGPPRPEDFDDASGEQLAADVVVGGKYRLVRPAGFGGMGVVWVARNLATDAEVAVKLLTAADAGSTEAAARFRREAHAAATLSHRGIVRIFDLVELDGRHQGALLMVMELLRGETLADTLDRKQKLEVDEALEIATALLSALGHAHAAGIVHRDLKPANIFMSVDPDGHITPKILDFGISKLESPGAPSITGDGDLLGTPAYMSPEQARGSSDSDARSDLFTMGILTYEMLTGANPFADGSYHSVVAAILEREPTPIPEIAPALWEVLAKTLQKRPADRFQSAEELGEALAAVREGRPPLPLARLSIPPSTTTSSPPPASMRRRSLPTVMSSESSAALERTRGRGALIAGFFGVLALALVVALVLRSRRDPEPSAVGRAPARASIPEVSVDDLPSATANTPATTTTTTPATTTAPATTTTTAPTTTIPPGKVHPPRPRPHPVGTAGAPATPPPAGTVARDPGF